MDITKECWCFVLAPVAAARAASCCPSRLQQQQQSVVRGPVHYQPMHLLLPPLSRLLNMLLLALAAYLGPVGQPLNQIASFYILCKAEDQLEII